MNFAPQRLDEATIVNILQKPWQETAPLACQTPRTAPGSHVFVRGLVEFSNICRRNCHYCGLRAQNTRLRRYRLAQADVLAAAKAAAVAGCDTIVLQSGEDACDAAWLAEVVREITTSLKLPVTLSVGERPVKDYELWRKAGAARYLLKHETSDPALYARLHPGHNLQERLDALRILKSLDYETGGGFMIGLPGQTIFSLARDVLLCRDLQLDMCGAGPFIPQHDTPLTNAARGSAELALSVLCALRLALPRANLPATTALATVDRANGQRDGLLAGANVLMPSFTPADLARDYAIYDSKNRVSIAGAASAIEAAGRTHTLNVPH